ncbi:MAG: menaquinone biosynthesis protein [Bacteroidia bacterium]
MDKVKISIVSYLNAKPFLYGLQQSKIANDIDLQEDMPSVCAQKLLTNQVDLGLVPVAVIPSLKNYHLVSDFCIGAQGKVASVMLYSKVPLNQITSIVLDYQSRTSVKLVQVLAKHWWKISPNWVPAENGFEQKINDTTAAVIIGDRTFDLNGSFPYAYDLADEWYKLTNLPFVFACWVSNKPLVNEFVAEFNKALQLGLDSRTELVSKMRLNDYKIDVNHYLNQNIKYNFGPTQKHALHLFWDYISTL